MVVRTPGCRVAAGHPAAWGTAGGALHRREDPVVADDPPDLRSERISATLAGQPSAPSATRRWTDNCRRYQI